MEPAIIEKWPGRTYELTIGATKEEGGSRSKKVKLGGMSTLPFLFFEGTIPNPPAVAMEVWDVEPTDWPDVLKNEYGDVLTDPAKWAKKCEEFGCDLICLRLKSADPDLKNSSADEITKTVKNVLSATSLPLIIVGCGNNEKDSSIIMSISESTKGENCLLGVATKENYKTFTAAALSGGHSIIAETPLDINLEKQLNILITDMGFSSDRIVIHPSTGGLGYGFEYCYTIIERTRLAALSGDKMMSQPIINFIGQETWKTKECKADETEKPEWGALKERGVLWETTTSVGYIQAGSDIIVVNHPSSVKEVRNYIQKLMIK
ncbi:MAG: acetyl-CoA decarbonylase/synthase complex subunit delta [Elusimicrobia bacterium CG06_land_8_20_14_3_00_38_11]|nr:MAG: acetyl-CoA decarbonylase/synthase complex subunit delta [Elusimicrobia bacterium CG06_land_8_20_14_3_00_38_11]